MSIKILFLSGAFVVSSVLPGSAVTYLESIDGDLSNFYLTPTPIVLEAGSNLLGGTLLGGEIDLDLFTIQVPAGFELSGIRVIDFLGGGEVPTAGSFLGLQAGTTLSSNPVPSSSFVDPIGFVIITPALAATDENVLQLITDNSPLGGVSALPAGSYAGWLNETTFPSSYTLDFVVTPVPEPGSGVLGLLGLVSLLRIRKRTA